MLGSFPAAGVRAHLGLLLLPLTLPDLSMVPLLQVQQPGCAACHQEEYDGDHEGKAEAAEDAQQEPAADG